MFARQQQQQEQEEKFFCNSHPSVEAAAFCEECSTMQGCSGYWCRECDKKIHEVFPTHQRTKPKRVEKKMCKKHPNYNAEEIFCWETKTFHCPLCAWESKISGDKITDAVDKAIQSTEKIFQGLEASRKKLSERKDKISFGLYGDSNPNSLELQKSQALSEIRSAFEKMRKVLDQRENDLLSEVEKSFDTQTECFNNEIKEISEAIEKCEKFVQEHAAVPSARKDASLLRKLLEMENEAKEVSSTAENLEKEPVVQITTTKVVTFEEKEKIVESLRSLGRIVETVDLPAPLNLRPINNGRDYIDFSWDKVERASTYQVMSKKTSSSDDEWVEVYNGPDMQTRCSNLEISTEYTFRVTPMYRGIKSVNASTCTAQIVNNISSTIFER